jgi:solute carrier family 25 carnitine/acylcarnitine transporter 20/29
LDEGKKEIFSRMKKEYQENQLMMAIPPPPSVTAKTQAQESVKDMVSSLFASACCVYTGQPFDTVKVRAQLKTGENIQMFKILGDTVRTGGVTALWRGSVPALTGQLLENSVVFTVNGFLKRHFHADIGHLNDEPDNVNYAKPVLIGGVTGILSAFVLCPCDVVKCRAQANILHGQGAVNVTDITKNIIKTSGVSGLWRGIGAQILRDVPFNATFFGSYDILCHLFQRHTKWSEGTVYFIAGG